MLTRPPAKSWTSRPLAAEANAQAVSRAGKGCELSGGLSRKFMNEWSRSLLGSKGGV